MPALDYDQVELSYLDALARENAEREQDIAQARKYHAGEHDVYLSDRIKEFLAIGAGTKSKFRMNVCRSVVTAVSERLIVAGFDTDEEANAEGAKEQSAWAWQVWQGNRMDALQDEVHDDTLVSGEHFVIVDWDAERKRPRFTPHPRYIDVDNGGDGYGCLMIYPDNNIYAAPSYAVKQWTETVRDENGKRKSRRRRTLYYPERIERYVYELGGWRPYIEDGQAWPLPWVDLAGNPLGIPVIHFRNKGLRCEAWDAIPLQDAINKALVDLLATADLTAFRIFVALGWIPTTDGREPKADGSNWLKITPGQIVGTTKSREQASFEAIDGEDPSAMAELVHQLVLWTAMVTDTPVSRFIATKQIASGDTLKQQEEPLEAKVDHRRMLFGNGWEDCMAMARRLANVFGEEELDESVQFSTLWQSRRSLDELKAKRELGVPLEQLWLEAGYSREQISAMKEMDEYQARLSIMQLGLENGG